MRRGHSKALPIASIDTHAPSEGGGVVGPVIFFAVKKQEAAGLILTRKAGKKKMVEFSQAGFEACGRDGQLREKRLFGIAGQARIPGTKLSKLSTLLRMRSGAYNQAARAAATF